MVPPLITLLPQKITLQIKFGTVTLGQHYKRIAVEGNDYDPYTTLFAGKKKPTGMIANMLGNSVEEEAKEPVAK